MCQFNKFKNKKEYYIRNLIIITKKIFIRKLHQITGVNINKIINKMITLKKNKPQFKILISTHHILNLSYQTIVKFKILCFNF